MQTDKLCGRRFNYWAPLLAVCKFFADDKYDDLLQLAEEDAQRIEQADRMSEVGDAVITVLLQHAHTQTPTDQATFSLTLKATTELVKEQIDWVRTWHPVKSAIANLGITRRRYHPAKGVTYEFDIDKINTLAAKRGISLEEETEAKKEEEPNEDGIDAFFSTCFLCNKPVHDEQEHTFLEGRKVHITCYREHRKKLQKSSNTQKCPNCGNTDPEGTTYCSQCKFRYVESYGKDNSDVF